MKKHIHKFGAHVDKNVAKNPIALAVAKQKLAQAVLDARIAVYMMDEGQRCQDMLFTAQIAINAAYMALDTTEGQTLDVRLLRGAVSTLNDAMHNNHWKKEYTQTVVKALEIVQDRFPQLNQDIANKAIAAAFQIQAAGNQLNPQHRKAA